MPKKQRILRGKSKSANSASNSKLKRKSGASCKCKNSPAKKPSQKKSETKPNLPKNQHPAKKIPANYKKDSRKAIIITGVPATGKTTIAKKWCTKYGWDYISLNNLVADNKLYTKIDKKDGAKIADLQALQKLANEKIKKSAHSIIIDGHLACEIKLGVQKIIILRLNPTELTKRLNARKYSKYKTEQNVKAEILDYCTIVSEHNYPKEMVYEIDTTDKTQIKIMRELKDIIYPKKTKRIVPKIDWTNFLLK